MDLRRDYYEVLGLPKNATERDINLAYKKLALLYHPTIIKSKKNEYEAQPQDCGDTTALELQAKRDLENACTFNKLGEAYDILGNLQRKAIYDMFGFRGLKEGVTGPNGFIPPYTYHGNPGLTFQQFFGVDNPFAHLQKLSCLPIDLHSGVTIDPKIKQPPIEKQLMLTFEEMYNGCLKKVIISRLRLFGSEVQPQEKMLNIPVKPGTLPGTKFTFPYEGDEGHQIKPTDVVFIIVPIAHDLFTLEGRNLILSNDIPLADTLSGFKVNVKTLDGRSFNVNIAGPILPGYERVIEGEGFPSTNGGEPGNLIIRIRTLYPLTLSQSQKKVLKQTLMENS